MKSYSERLHAVIPGGAHTYSRGDDQFPANAPPILSRAKGAYVWDPDGNRYLDYGMGLRAVTLGYAHERVNRAAMQEIENGVNLTRPSLTELSAAELLVDLIPSVEMVKFAKNGSNVTTAAVKIARAYTGRRYVCVPRQHPFFSFDDWFIGTTPIKRGVLSEHSSTTLVFDYGDLATLQALFDVHGDQIAAVMLEPATTMTPCPPQCSRSLSCEQLCSDCPHSAQSFLHGVQALCRRYGALFILDEMITGFRWHLQGAQSFFGVDPDITTFGKGMANGFSVAAVAGKREFMQLGGITSEGAERVFLLSSTHGGEMPGLGAFIETIRIYKEMNVVEHLWRYGQKLSDGMNDCASTLGLSDYFHTDGPAIGFNYIARDRDGAVSLPLRTLFSQELVNHNVLMPWIAVSMAHGDAELTKTLEAVDLALRVYRQALESKTENFLQGAAIKPVFRQYN